MENVNMVEIKKIRILLLRGEIDYIEAKKQCKPLIDSMNKKSNEIAKRHNKKPILFNFSSLMR